MRGSHRSLSRQEKPEGHRKRFRGMHKDIEGHILGGEGAQTRILSGTPQGRVAGHT